MHDSGNEVRCEADVIAERRSRVLGLKENVDGRAPCRLQKPQPAPETEQSQLLDTHPEVRLDFKHVRNALKQGYTRPFLLVDTGIVRTKVRRFKAAMPRVHPHYAVKANPDPRVLKVLIEEGAGFEIASIAELDILLEARGAGGRGLLQQPGEVRATPSSYAAAKGVEWFVVDSVEELRKIHGIKPDAKLYVRIEAPNVGSDWPLSGKFGMKPAEVDGGHRRGGRRSRPTSRA